MLLIIGLAIIGYAIFLGRRIYLEERAVKAIHECLADLELEIEEHLRKEETKIIKKAKNYLTKKKTTKKAGKNVRK